MLRVPVRTAADGYRPDHRANAHPEARGAPLQRVGQDHVDVIVVVAAVAAPEAGRLSHRLRKGRQPPAGPRARPCTRHGTGALRAAPAFQPKNGTSKSSQSARRAAPAHAPPRGSSPPPTGSGRNPTRPGGQNPTRAAKRPKLEQRDTAKKVPEGPESPFWRARAAQAWHPQIARCGCANLPTTALQSTGGGLGHDRRARWFSLVTFCQVELQSNTSL